MARFTWRDIEQVALGLVRQYPETDPLGITVEQLREFVMNLPEFSDDPEAASLSTLEAIQAAWYDLYES